MNSDTTNAIVYGSSPEEEAADHSLKGALPASSWGTSTGSTRRVKKVKCSSSR